MAAVKEFELSVGDLRFECMLVGDGRGAVTAAIFWLKARAQWKERTVSEITTPPDSPIADLMQRIAETGRRIHDRPLPAPQTIEGYDEHECHDG